MGNRPYIVYAYAFDDNSGGKIALYLLCERLRALGESASLWPAIKPGKPWITGFRSARDLLQYHRQLRGFPFRIGDTVLPEARWRDVQDAIVIYPEVVSGNPLNARNIVRWFLHRPGYHMGVVNYGANEQYFFYQDAFNDPSINPDASHRLTLTWLNPVYRQTNFGERSGSCYLLRKGADRAKGLDLTGELCVDDMSHAERASAFNRCEHLISYDLYSMHSVFAAMCGCTPIIVPEEGRSREEWFPDPSDQYGLAYGWENVDEAIATRGRLMDKLARTREVEDDMLRAFVAKTQDFSLNPSPSARKKRTR